MHKGRNGLDNFIELGISQDRTIPILAFIFMGEGIDKER